MNRQLVPFFPDHYVKKKTVMNELEEEKEEKTAEKV